MNAIDTIKEGNTKEAIIITCGDDIDVFSSGATLSDLVVMHRIFSDFVSAQVRGHST